MAENEFSWNITEDRDITESNLIVPVMFHGMFFTCCTVSWEKTF